MSWFSILKKRGRFVWVLYSGNNHEILRSKRTYNAAHHARGAAHRLFRLVSRASFNYGRDLRDLKRRAARS